MATLVTCVGITDPIRTQHDGPILHIARNFRPEKILLIYSEGTVEKRKDLEKALRSIDGYAPEIVIHDEVIKDSDIYIFDRVLKIFNNILERYSKSEEEIYLNLSSATPQVISAMYTLNHLSGMNVRAFQVATPINGSNRRNEPDKNETIDSLIKNNLDARPEYISRIKEDVGENLKEMITLNTYRDLIRNFNYEAVYRLACKDNIVQKKSVVFGNKEVKFNKALEDIDTSIKTQALLPDVAELELTIKQKRLLNAWLLLGLQSKRELVGEFLMRLKNVAEYGAELYIMNKYPDVLIFRDNKPYLKDPHGELAKHLNEILEKSKNEKQGKVNFEAVWLNLLYYIDIIQFYDKKDPLLEPLRSIKGTGAKRNQVAHGLEEIGKLSSHNRYIQSAFMIVKANLDLSEDEWQVFAPLKKKKNLVEKNNKRFSKKIDEDYFDRLNDKLYKFFSN